MVKGRDWLKFLQVLALKGWTGIVCLVLLIALACVLKATSVEAIHAITLLILAIVVLIIVAFAATRWEKKSDGGIVDKEENSSSPSERVIDSDPPVKKP